MFPFGDEEERPTIAWSAQSNNFYNVDTGQFVSRLEGIESLQLGRPFGQPGLVDALGRKVPSIDQLIPNSFDLQFVNNLRGANQTFENVYGQRAPSSRYYLSVATYTDDEGRVHLTIVPSKGGQPINAEDEDRRLAGAIANDLGLAMGAEGSDLVLERVTHIYHFTVQ